MALSKIRNDSLADTAVHGRRNLIINGAMQVWQRSTSVTATSSGYSTADRWSHNASGGTLSLSRQELTAGQTDIPSQFKYFYRLNATTADNNAAIRTKVEDVKTVQGQHTLSFYAKGTNPSGGHFQVEGRQYFGTGGSAQVQIYNDFVVTSSWQRFTFTLDVASISGKTISDADSSYWIQFLQPSDDTSTDAWTLDITGVQLEVGDTATPFEHRSFGEELALCQRYFCKTYNHETAPGTVTTVGQLFNSVDSAQNYAYTGQFTFPVTMRATPSVTVYNPNNGTAGQLAADSGNKSAITNAPGTGRVAIGVSNTSIGTSVFVRAHATADSEL